MERGGAQEKQNTKILLSCPGEGRIRHEEKGSWYLNEKGGSQGLGSDVRPHEG